GRKTLTFLNINKQYQYAPQFEKSLNFIEGWFFVRDYNRDGLDDFFIENFGNISVYKNISKGNTLKFKMQNEILTDTTDLLPGLKANIYADQSAVPAFEDIDKDGDIDIIAQNILSKSFDLYINVQVEGHLPKDSMALIWVDDSWGGSLIDSIFSNIYNNREESNICLFDEDGDEDLDLLVSTDGKNAPFILYNLRKDLNLNVDSFNSYTPHFPLNDTSLMYNPSIAYFDLDLDGIKDLVISSIRRYSMVEQQAILLLNKKNGKFNLSSAN
ncbi:MAG: VCBS repeat-containing protein, partial [Bacteroidetes bacterium]|nr:VCBS repeat-containing protein [Bacteroidota bacterium]